MNIDEKLKPFKIYLRNNNNFECEPQTTILQASINEEKVLEHNCMSGRCRSCKVKVLEGKTIDTKENTILSEKEKKEGYILSCISKPLSNVKLDIEDLGKIKLNKVRIVPSKIESLRNISPSVIKVILRLPPNSNFNFLPGQYVNIIKGRIRRSYSIANNKRADNKLEFFIKKVRNGVMSEYWFNEADEDDLLRIEGPLGTFFLRASKDTQDIVFLATGTGIAPIKAILEQISNNDSYIQNKKVLVLWGARYEEDIFWNPEGTNNIKFIPILSGKNVNWKGKTGYVQNILLSKYNNLKNVQVYACGLSDMINSSKDLLIKNGLKENNFFSDAFVSSN
ncbi:MAG: CDP-6-deoxy-L-threo-D-glycero-4-hexulose-3-dehydrase reductase [Bacteroidetes bacterium]|nr:MAG: CDP-6-deoxy-L-threo-D-glycero-4-hexulose-3-dehydrase reductase [Bacteroidota bacterium]